MSDIGRDPIFRQQNERGSIETDDVQRLLAGIEPESEPVRQETGAPRAVAGPAAPVRANPGIGPNFGPMVRLR